MWRPRWRVPRACSDTVILSRRTRLPLNAEPRDAVNRRGDREEELGGQRKSAPANSPTPTTTSSFGGPVADKTEAELRRRTRTQEAFERVAPGLGFRGRAPARGRVLGFPVDDSDAEFGKWTPTATCAPYEFGVVERV